MPQAVARLYLASGRDADALMFVTEVFEQIKTTKDEGQVRNCAPALARALYMFGKHFSGEQIRRIKDAITSQGYRPCWRARDEENHAAQFCLQHVSARPILPDATWDSGDGKQYTSAEMMAEAESRILQRGKGFYRAGNNSAALHHVCHGQCVFFLHCRRGR